MNAAILKSKAPLIAAILVVVASVALLGWTWFRRYPLIERKHADAQAIVDLEAEVDKLEREWPEEREAKIIAEYYDAVGNLFSGDPEASTWAAQMNEPSASTTLSVGVKLDKATPLADEGLARHVICVPAYWDFRAKHQATNVFASVLNFLRELDEDRGRRVEIVDLSFKGNGDSVNEARATLRLWFAKDLPPAPVLTQVTPAP